MLELLLATAESSSIPVAAVCSIIAAAVGAAGGYVAKKTHIANDPLTVATMKDYVTRDEFDREISELRKTITDGERQTQNKLDRLIDAVGELKGVVSTLK